MDYAQFAPVVLAICGSGLQWIRQYSKNSEWIPGIVAFLVSTGVYFVVHPLTTDWRLEVLSGIVTVAGYIAATLGGTYTAARAADTISFVPRTNSL